MNEQYFKIDLTTGSIIDSAVFDSVVDNIPTDYKLGWGNDVFYEPYYDLEKGAWSDRKSASDILELKKDKFKLEFKNKCELEIIKGFTATNKHFYRTNRDDQLNMIGQRDELLEDSTILTVMWNTEDVGYIEHTREEWLDIYKQAFAHKKAQLFKYDSLKQQVNNATTHEELAVITWNE